MTLTWQMFTVSLIIAGVLIYYVRHPLVWLMPLTVLFMCLPYIMRAVEIGRDRRTKQYEEKELRLKDISKEYAIALHSHRGMVHWTLIFEDEADDRRVYVLTVAMNKQDAHSFLCLGGMYRVKWLAVSRVICAMEDTGRERVKGVSEIGRI